MTDVPVDGAAATRTAAPEGLTAAEEEELRAEIAKVGRAAATSCWGGERARTWGATGAGLGGFISLLMAALPVRLPELC